MLATVADDTRQTVLYLLAECQRAIQASNGKEVQRILGEIQRLGYNAIPDEGHICNFCNRGGQLYCFAEAVKSVRGIR